MIAICSEDGRFRDFLTSVLSEHHMTLASLEQATLVIVDLDTVRALPEGKRVLTVSANVFSDAELLRPFLQQELIALCQTKLGWQPMVDNLSKKDEPIDEFSLGEGCLYRLGERIELTPAEFRLFSLLLERRGEIVPLDECEAACRVRATRGNSVSVTLASLRKKLDYCYGMRYFVCHRGKGYAMVKKA